MDMMTTKLSQIEPINKCMSSVIECVTSFFCHVNVATRKQKNSLSPKIKFIYDIEKVRRRRIIAEKSKQCLL